MKGEVRRRRKRPRLDIPVSITQPLSDEEAISLFFRGRKEVVERDARGRPVRLGKGTFGSVYAIADTDLCVKIMHWKNHQVGWVVKELKLSKTMSNTEIGPHVTEARRISAVPPGRGGYGFVVMERYDTSLKKYLRGNHISRAQLHEVEKSLAKLIGKMMTRQVICFDLTPGNVVIKERGGSLKVRLIDFDGRHCKRGVWKLNWQFHAIHQGMRMVRARQITALRGVLMFILLVTTRNQTGITLSAWIPRLEASWRDTFMTICSLPLATSTLDHYGATSKGMTKACERWKRSGRQPPPIQETLFTLTQGSEFSSPSTAATELL